MVSGSSTSRVASRSSSPGADKRFLLFCETNGYVGEVSAEAAGIIATLFALSHLSFQHEADQLSEAYLRLYAVAGDHPEAGEIVRPEQVPCC